MLRLRILLLGIALFSYYAYGKINRFEKKISTALVSVNHNYSLGISSRLENIDKKIDYTANTAGLSGVEVSFKGLTLAYLTSNGFDENDIERRGKTSYEDIRGGLFLGKEDQWVLLGYYNRYKGFYVGNSSEVDPAAPLYIQRKDIETFNAGGALMYIFEPKNFSAAAAYVQSAQQTKSGGSLLAMFSFDANSFTAGSDFIPDSYESNFGEQRDLRKGKVATASLSVGYSYTFVVWEVLFVNGTVLFGRGIQTKEYEYGQESKSENDTANKFNMGYSLGYNGESFYAGMSFVKNETEYRIGSLKVEPDLNSTRFFLGIRF